LAICVSLHTSLAYPARRSETSATIALALSLALALITKASLALATIKLALSLAAASPVASGVLVGPCGNQRGRGNGSVIPYALS
jgi:hypothetical protein